MMFTAKKKEGVHDMKKKQLLELKIPEVTREILELAKNDQSRQYRGYWGNFEVYQRGVYLRTQKEEGILKVVVFLTHEIRAGRKLPAYILFIDKDADNFITYITATKKWSNAMLHNLLPPNYREFSKEYIGEDDREILKGYLSVRKGSVYELYGYQREVRLRQRIRRDKKITDPWDKMMEQVPAVPKDWEQWVARNGITQHFLFYKYKRNGIKEAYCSHCQKMVPVKNPQYNKEGVCSKCRHPIIYKSIGRFKRLWTQKENVYLLQKCQFGIVIRQFEVRSLYSQEKFKTPQIIWHEERRTFFDSAWNQKIFCYGLYNNREYRWVETKDYFSSSIRNIFSHKGRVYRRTLPGLAKKELCRTGLPEMVQWKNWIDPEQYLFRLSYFPIIEQIVKGRLFCLAEELLRQDHRFTESSKLTKALEIDRYRLQRLRENQGGLLYLQWLQYEKCCGKNFAEEDLNWFVKEKFKPENFEFIENRMSLQQIKNYLIKQNAQSNESFQQVLATWKDYLDMAERIQMNINDPIVYRTSRL